MPCEMCGGEGSVVVDRGVRNAGMRCDTPCLGRRGKKASKIRLVDERQDNAPVHAKRDSRSKGRLIEIVVEE
jgi:hypothetical protein